ncbi:hypothetical protein GCM10022214_00030 [Actinomadura miaoliensis]|uniref:Uncharacterized protein n=1 Tax=Actinomadura miaoliensis TaxID=430685 RepID=A0ABP7UUU7_9ACTN
MTVLSGLRFLAHYARDYAYAGDDALIRAATCNSSQGRRVELSTDGAMGPSRLVTLTRAVPIPITERAAPLDGLASDGPQLVSAAAYLVGDLMCTLGHPDVLHITTEGRLLQLGGGVTRTRTTNGRLGLVRRPFKWRGSGAARRRHARTRVLNPAVQRPRQ